MIYTVTIKELLERKVPIEASSEDDAIQQVKQQYDLSNIVLDYSDHTETIFEANLKD